MPVSDTALIRSYSGLTRMLSPFLPLWVKRRALQGKEDPSRSSERFGKSQKPRPEGPLIWMHGASVGECTMLLPLIDRFLSYNPKLNVLVTSGTLSSATLLAKRLPKRAFHQYVPLDAPKSVSNFLDHWKPDMAIWAESEIWPNLIRLTSERNISMALINARLSEASLNGWRKRRKSAIALFGCFDKILAADEQTANSLSVLLGKNIEPSGNLKDAAPPLSYDEKELKRLKKNLGNRPVWCAASTHAGEDELILAAHESLLEEHKNALLILAPRHPERRDDITALMDKMPLSYRVRSQAERPLSSNAVYFFDSVGELGLAYSLSQISFVCGSLIKGLKGHNPLEPARLGNAVLTGSHISSFADNYMSMFAFNAAERIFNPDMIAPALSHLFNNPDERLMRAQAALKFSQSRDEILDYVWDEISPLFKGRI